MSERKIGIIIRESLPHEQEPFLTEEQLLKLKTVGGVALGIIGIAGIVTLSAVAPNMLTAFDKIFSVKHPNHRYSRKEKARKIAKTFYYLKDSGYIRMTPTGNDLKIFLTRLGRKKLNKLNFNTIVIKKPKMWDGRWWQVAADIPTKKYKRAADSFRQKLKDMRFFFLQRTLWFYPYDPRSEIEFVVNHFGIERFVTVMEINRLDKDDEKVMIRFFRKEGIL